jgi:DNA ligase-1
MNDKVELVADFFRSAGSDAGWALYLLLGGKISRIASPKELREWAGELGELPGWLVDECYEFTGDLAECLARILPEGDGIGDVGLAYLVCSVLKPLRKASAEQKKSSLGTLWGTMTSSERLVCNKMMTGAFRVGVAKGAILRALSQAYSLPVSIVAERVTGSWTPEEASIDELLKGDQVAPSVPYPFALAHPLEGDPQKLGEPSAWCAEWKWDGIRAQLIRRGETLFLWSRGEESIGERFPELADWGLTLPSGIVLDGEIIAGAVNRVRPFADLQRRIGKKKLSPALLRDIPCSFVAYDILELEGRDLRGEPFSARRRLLEEFFARKATDSAFQYRGDVPAHLSPLVPFDTWAELSLLRESSRSRYVEGLMLKKWNSTYPVGRTRGAWWKWKVAPYTIDAVLVYAQRGHGRRAGLFTDYTFALWKDGELVPVAKAYSGLTEPEMKKVDEFVRVHKLERFGPVVRVKPVLVMELAFEGGQHSTRHRSGIALRFPRILRWRQDKRPEDADTVDGLRRILGM